MTDFSLALAQATRSLTFVQKHDAAVFIASVQAHESKVRGRRPKPHEVICAAYAAALGVIDQIVGNPMKFLGAPGEARQTLLAVTGGIFSTALPARLVTQAENTLAYIDQAGDRFGSTPASIVRDRQVVQLAGRDWFRRGCRSNDSAIGRELGISHTQARDRKIARSLRVLQALAHDCKEVWNKKLRPVAEKAPTGSGKVLRVGYQMAA